MSRPPTQAEMRETNPNMKQRCGKCDLVMTANADFGTFEDMLTLTMSGGYGEYVDSAFVKDEELEFTLCHECAHKLMAEFFGQWQFTGWHPRTEDKYCDGWSSLTDEEIDQYWKEIDSNG